MKPFNWKGNTDALTRELMEASDIESYIRKNQNSFISCSVMDQLIVYYKRMHITKAELARRACISDVYLHQLFAGRRQPSRNRLLCLCIALELSFEETQRLLKQASLAELYPRHKRDAIIIHGLLNHVSVEGLNDKLLLEGEAAL